MKTIKVIHYPTGGNRTTEIFEGNNVKIIEAYLHELTNKDIRQDRIFGATMDVGSKLHWVILIEIDEEVYLAGLNSKVYVMVDGKTVASYESVIID